MKATPTKIGSLVLSLLLSLCVMETTELWGKTASKPATLLKRADDCRRSLYGSRKKTKYRHNWLKCTRLYESIYSSYPKSEQAPWAMYRKARMFTKLYEYSGLQKDLDDAVELFRRLVEEY